MQSAKTLFLKTYGKQRRILPGWITTDNHRQAFDSSLSTDGDVSVFEHTKPPVGRRRKTSVASQKAARPAKKKAMQCLRERSCEENVFTPTDLCPQPTKQSRTARIKADSPAKTTVKTCVMGNSSDEENFSNENSSMPSAPRPGPAQQTKATRGRAVRPARKKAALLVTGISSDEENISRVLSSAPLATQQGRTNRPNRLVSGVLMRRRRQNAPITSESDGDSSVKCHKKSFQTKRTSNFPPPSAGRFVTRRKRAPATSTFKPPKAPISLLNSSDDFTSVGEGVFDGSSNRHPARRKRRVSSVCLESSVDAAVGDSFTINPFREISLGELADHSLGPPSRKPIFCSTPSASSALRRPRLSPSPAARQSPPVSRIEDPDESGKRRGRVEDLSADLFKEPECVKAESSCGDGGRDARVERGDAQASARPLATDSESSSRFVSAAGGLDWLIEALREECLTRRCVVPLKRLEALSASLLLVSSTTYSSCLGLSDHSSHEANQQLPTVGTAEPSPSLVETSSGSRPTEPPSSADLSDDCRQRVERSSEFIGSSVEFIPGTQPLPADAPQNPLSATKRRGLPRKSDTAVERSSSNSVNTDENGQTPERPPKEVDSAPENAAVEKHSSVIIIEDCAEKLLLDLKEKCLAEKPDVVIKRLSSSQLNEILQSVESKLAHHHAKTESEGDASSSEESRAHVTKRRSTSPESTEAANPGGTRPKRKRASPAPKERKRRSAEADRPGTTRKACVSGLSVSRWKNKGSVHLFKSRMGRDGGAKKVDCSINELISKQPPKATQKQEAFGAVMNFSTPDRAGRLNLSSLLAELTPNTHTWSRLKAALSVHRKMRLTPRNLRLSEPGSPARTELGDASQDLFATPFRTPFRKHLRTQLLNADSLQVSCDDGDLSDAEKVYAECGQQGPLSWEECILPHRMKQCVKIGEGTFGEVFSTTNASGDTVALKVIPLEGTEKVNGEEQKSFGEILHEIIISKELSSLKEKQQNQTCGFIGLNDLHCVRGCYPPDFLKAWDVFDKVKCSENDRPDFFEQDQLFLILEFEFGGSDLENSNGTLTSLGVARSILHQVTAALAVAEQELQFEHRDLHWGNVLVKTTKQKKGSFLLNGESHSLETKGVLVRIIDYSLSRLEIDGLTVSCDISNDEELFMGQGDYQFEIYRLMRQENGNNWSSYHPHSNVLWLHYLCSKLLSMKYRGAGGRGAKDVREELTRFHDNVLQYSSATEALQKCPMFR